MNKIKLLDSKMAVDKMLFGIGAVLFVYVAVRASILSFTYDESWTYLCYVLRRFVNYKHFSQGDTNNHLLNTWLMELSVKFFGVSEFTLRLPNVLFYLVYLVFSAKLVRHLSSNTLIIGSFVLLNCSPFLLDFFSLARGYGISIALVMASLYYAYKFIAKEGSYWVGLVSILFAALAVFAYFSLINYLLILSGLLLVQNCIRLINTKTINGRYKFPTIIGTCIIILVPLSALFYIIPVLNHLKESGSMNFGGTEGFWKDSVGYLIECTLYRRPHIDILDDTFRVFIIDTLIAVLVVIVFIISKKKMKTINLFLVFTISALLLSFLANYMQNTLLNIPYPQGRYAFIFFILFILLVIFLFEQLHDLFGKISKTIYLVITSLFMINFLCAINFNHVHDWHTENDVKGMMSYLEKNKEHIIPKKDNISIGVSFQWRSDVNFYRVIRHLDWMNLIDARTSFSPLNDYFYVGEEDSTLYKGLEYVVLKKYPDSKTMLLKNTAKWRSETLFAGKNNFEDNAINNNHPTITTEHPFNGKYCSKLTEKNGFSPILKDTVNSNFIKYKKVIVTIKAMAYINSLNTDATIVFSHEGDGKLLNYYSFSIQEMVKKPGVWTPICATIILPEDIPLNSTIGGYCWNIGHHDVYIDNLEMTIVGYEK